MPKIWTSRPPASSPGGRVAWDVLTEQRPGRKILELWFAPEMDDGTWNAKYDDGEYRDVDVLVTRHHVNLQKSAKLHFEAGLNAGRAGAEALQEDAALFLTPQTSPLDRAEFERGVAQGLAERIGRLQLVLRTSNASKLAEINRYGLPVRGEPGPDLAEVDGTPEQVAMYKALAAGPAVLVDDTSLDIEGFEAGVNIRWLLAHLAEQLKGRQLPKAVWRVTLAVHDGFHLYLAKAEVHGRMTAEPRGEGFSFDRFFIPDGCEQTVAELDIAGKKGEVSARKQAVENLLGGRCAVVAVSSIAPWAGGYQAA